MLKEGDALPPFEALDQDGAPVRSADFEGKPLVVYFYPKDDTPGCTREACSFRDAYADFRAAGVEILAVSADPPASHLRFAAKHGLPFRLVSDPSRAMIEAFGAWGEKKMYGKSYQGILRCTFVVGPDGRVRKVFPKVSPEGHAAEVLASVSGA